MHETRRKSPFFNYFSHAMRKKSRAMRNNSAGFRIPVRNILHHVALLQAGKRFCLARPFLPLCWHGYCSSAFYIFAESFFADTLSRLGNMQVIVFIGDAYPDEVQLAKIVRLMASDHHLKINHTPAGFLNTLLRPLDCETVALALISNRDELESLLPLREISMDIPLILVLPDSHRKTISLAHRLRPRFLGFLQNGLSEVGPFLSKILQRSRHVAETND
jgi:hypothetical protein